MSKGAPLAFADDGVVLEPLPPEEAIRFFEAKGFRVSFAWQDVWQQEHARAFTVAKVMRYDILEDIRRAVDAALREGWTLDRFRRELTPILQSKGWWGRKPLADLPVSESLRDEVRAEGAADRLVQLGSPRRLAIIYNTNLRVARAAGRWERIMRTAGRRPFLRYSAVLDSRTRPLHRAWHGTILPVDHEWWDTHFPPNGWNCRCTVQALSRRDLARKGLTVSRRPPSDGFRIYRNKRRPELGTIRVPKGIDPGWAYNVGKANMRGLTPPPLDGPLQIPSTGVADSLPLPPVREVSADRLLPRDPDSTDANIQAFLESFGATRDRPVVFRDRLDEPVVISEDFFRRPDGSSKLSSGLRREALLLLADAIRDPDEIWWHWEPIRLADGAVEFRLRRRYVARFVVAGKRAPLIVVMDIGKDGWKGVTAFRATSERNLRNARIGVLAYRRNAKSGR